MLSSTSRTGRPAIELVASQPPADEERELVALVRAAAGGDAGAWTRIVERYDGTLRRIARAYRLGPADVDDVVQTTWLELLVMIERIREPAALGGWLATVTRRGALRRRRAPLREQPTDDPRLGDRADGEVLEDGVLIEERDAALRSALHGLPDRQRRLLLVLLTQPNLDYRQIGEQLGMPVGSIGPIRGRALARLARDEQLRALAA
jgi:RNA polymerase sigma factor (sigma-70 family)